MIKDISRIKEHNPKYIKDFMEGCVIEEKIDTHYITIDIVSRSDIKIKKANGNEIDRVDLILNSMWNNLFFDWNFLKVKNTEWFNSHVGYTIKLFYIPCTKPLMTEYDSNIRYIFDKVIFNGHELDTEYIISDLIFPKVYNIDYKKKMQKNHNINDLYNEHIDKVLSGDEDIKDMFLKLIDTENSKKFAVNEPEGYIFKYNNKLFQLILNNKERKIEQEKSSYEFVLSDFIKFCKTNNYTEKIVPSYVVTICNLFNDYIINNEKKTHYMENMVNPESIEAPYLGEKFDIGYECIPDQLTKTLCKESLLYKNIFKILLANLRRGKDFSHCIYLNKKEVDAWNNIMKSLKIRNRYI
ncbi:MAG: hypothetical protein [Wendovervirus sonii]|uniref:RNA ligase n=1 Tax=phage Lak_Megaphage_Sonny TaxID=3109229 RepID=A0ABZ0Z4Y9_9CAUD|nr:MAG: hypothetical protein [phage Lak_Megaphage_Sonny]